MSGRNDPSAASIAPLADAQLKATADVLARAFCGNPLNCAVNRFSDPARRFRSNRDSMRALLPIARQHGRVLVATLNGVVAGGLVASPPGRFPLPAPPLGIRLRSLMRQGWSVARRWGRVFETLEALHPPEPHWYLAVLGVDRPAQRRGVGAALLSRWLADVDRDPAPAYLETDREANVRFYGRTGFAPVGETAVLGVRTWLMQRPPAFGRRDSLGSRS
ncbi:MAG: GNAT family N-acetyltransferase [Deltaproteobacteria bacterium]|nr:GNAT family N-acetyltransferase [Deltaproteobacteria bacterium]